MLRISIIKRFLAIDVPIKYCNLKCKYCYINLLKKSEQCSPSFLYSPEHIGKCLSVKRLGGLCIINLTGGGETLIPKEMPAYIYYILKEGHFLEVVTNGTITKRFEEISTFPHEFLSRLEFKFSFHFAELTRTKLIDTFFHNVILMQKSGCSISVELMPDDNIINDIPTIISLCKKNLGANCHITIGRNDLVSNMELLTKYSQEDYIKTWSIFESPMFDFKFDIFKIKRNEFCYAGAWSLYIDLGTGDSKQCYGQLINQNIFKNPDKEIVFQPVGYRCRQPYCYNGHAFLTMGCIPELKTPTYADIRNRKTCYGEEWLKEPLKSAFSQKLQDANYVLNQNEKSLYNKKQVLLNIFYALKDSPEIYRKIKEKFYRRILK